MEMQRPQRHTNNCKKTHSFSLPRTRTFSPFKSCFWTPFWAFFLPVVHSKHLISRLECWFLWKYTAATSHAGSPITSWQCAKENEWLNLSIPIIHKEMDSFVLTALCIPCIIIACCQGGRKEERRERGGNCAERKATADPSVRLNALEAQRGREQCLILRGVGLVLDLFFLSFFGQ